MSMLGDGERKPNKISGAIQPFVPPTGLAPVVTKRLKPKSMSLALGHTEQHSTITLLAFKSPWMMGGD
eukprot:CAMPEP_0204010724 /NCGR_PEP_ID=MMETSP0360-20130528/22752_1 /ASSEMBLY_ACC=CAM_ASM_000342 /TAXON_ID=268821 /ORGANISM="Scrippsiella Hangoei, Strain SHTV-5" /LENGTH=67 /DNA_ID=CAMNT_0050953225 /DNA_START=124 /DNA_END=327 /DNA_ORIENTATION=-